MNRQEYTEKKMIYEFLDTYSDFICKKLDGLKIPYKHYDEWDDIRLFTHG